MNISDNRVIADIQAEFNSKFPYLQLEFHAEAHKEGEGSSVKTRIPADKTIGEVRSKHTSGDFSIDGHLHAGTLEEKFRDMYGLNVQVMRRKRGAWLQTIHTDGLSLTELNRDAENFHRSLEEQQPEFISLDEPE